MMLMVVDRRLGFTEDGRGVIKGGGDLVLVKTVTDVVLLSLSLSGWCGAGVEVGECAGDCGSLTGDSIRLIGRDRFFPMEHCCSC